MIVQDGTLIDGTGAPPARDAVIAIRDGRIVVKDGVVVRRA